ncbi:mitochondrial FAD carrier protein FLX1 [Histoplasma capsulatum var. duboisii H88]|uniref:Mitochondrial FAD carrier protein FLX1 n=1 Tax=Ajellomyces capsulatus (strain H88) TaxID=544711 RepID=F0UQW7_AJEC8|nr:mitochondrial FAD carrier protein FLX1 [Histoplasma capsulatum var. duboisii H88]
MVQFSEETKWISAFHHLPCEPRPQLLKYVLSRSTLTVRKFKRHKLTLTSRSQAFLALRMNSTNFYEMTWMLAGFSRENAAVEHRVDSRANLLYFKKRANFILDLTEIQTTNTNNTTATSVFEKNRKTVSWLWGEPKGPLRTSQNESMNGNHGLSPSVVETIAGFAAGISSTLVVHPLDMIKTRLQVDRFSTSRIGSSLCIARSIVQNEGGIVTGFYRGLTPNIVGNSVSWGLYFLWYSNIKDTLHVLHGSRKEEGLGSLDYFAASGAAGVLTAFLTNPIWVIKTRMLSTGSQVPGAYPSLVAGARSIYRSEGVMGFYRGMIPALFGVSHGALQFMSYEKLKQCRAAPSSVVGMSGNGNANGGTTTKDLKLGNMDYLVLSGTSKVFAGCVTYPYQVLKARLQTYDAAGTYRGVIDAIGQIWRRERVMGFYKGLGPNLLRVLPSTWVTFLGL